MDYDELAKWMEARRIGDQLRFWLSNQIIGPHNYTILEDLATTGTAALQITLTDTKPTPTINIQRIETQVQKETAEEPSLLSSIVKARKVEVKKSE
jgi:RecB family endonuclease NucS